MCKSVEINVRKCPKTALDSCILLRQELNMARPALSRSETLHALLGTPLQDAEEGSSICLGWSFI
jgi:hypothetical protein